jgi:D-sedoheptulose 7-phosphate isomerase
VIRDLFDDHANELRDALDALAGQADAMEAAAQAIADAIGSGGRLLAAGNGGSAAEAQHLTAEFLGRLRPDRDREPLPAFALHADTSTVTAAANDYGYEEIFARQVRGLGRAGDVLVVLSTSGSSRNCVRAVEDAAAMGITTIGLLGGTRRALHELCDHVLAVPSENIGAIQECHLVLVHVLTERTEDLLGAV